MFLKRCRFGRNLRLWAHSARRVHTITKGEKHITYLDNGMRVMTYDDTRAVSAVGLFISVGVRCESDESKGCSALYDKCVFQSNKKLRAQEFAEDLSFMGNSIAVNNHRECCSYVMQCPSYYVNEATEMLSSALITPSFDDPAEFQFVKDALVEQIPLRTRDPMSMCFEKLHHAAFGKRGIGRDAHYSEANVSAITPKMMDDFVRTQVRPSRMVVLASGVSDHAAYVKSVQNCFTFSDSSALAHEPLPPTVYTGGVELHHNTEAPDSVEKFEEKNLTHISIFYPAPTATHKDNYIVAVIQCMLGGGASFSSGGPGKGMLTKLYREVVCREAYVQSAECVTAAYSDVGLLGIYGCAPHENAKQLQRALMFQLGTIPQRINQYHVDMAKNLLLSQMFLVNDTTTGQIEENGRYLLLFDKATSYAETAAKINAVTYADVCRVAHEIIDGKPSMSVYGNTEGIESDPQVIHDSVIKYAGKAL